MYACDPSGAGKEMERSLKNRHPAIPSAPLRRGNEASNNQGLVKWERMPRS